MSWTQPQSNPLVGHSPPSDRTALIDSLNRQIQVFETHFRRFFRGEDRSNLHSALFNVPGRLVAGCWGDYENMAPVFRRVLGSHSAEEIGRRMKGLAARPGVFQITCLLVSYLIARQQQILIEQRSGGSHSDNERLEEMAFLFETGRMILSTARNDAKQFPGEANDSMPLLPANEQSQFLSRLRKSSSSELSWHRRLMASLTAFNFLFHGEMRDGIFNHGPYPLGQGRCLLVKELTELHNDMFPWAKCVRGLPDSIVRGLVLRDVMMSFDVLGGVALQPAETDELIELDGVFEIVDGELVDISQSGAEELLKRVAEAQFLLYQEFLAWDDERKLRYGTILHANFLRGFWELLPSEEARQFGEAAITGYEQSSQMHFEELRAMQLPLVMEHIARTEGPIFSPVTCDRVL